MQRYKRNRRGRKRTVNITPIIFLTVLIIGTFGFIGVKGFEEELKVNPTDQVPIRATNSMNRVESGQNRNDLVSNTEMDWNLTLVNKYNAVPNDYEINLVELPGGEKVDERIYKPLMAMILFGIGLLLVYNPFRGAIMMVYVIGASILADGLINIWSMFLITRLLKKLRKKAKENPVPEEEEAAYWLSESEEKK